MAATTKASKASLARKNAEALKAQRKTARDQRAKNVVAGGRPGKKGPSLVNQSKTKKNK
ncbi:hypothetical protein [Lewinella sp. 4G2]|uniref:hypothetical protein n=1 Tax=Lewinella sp. 4G2 TaxID=1803372 RepID=UPI0012FC7270|nr:hypothetical protein [Lewinella sp. 4G2]